MSGGRAPVILYVLLGAFLGGAAVQYWIVTANVAGPTGAQTLPLGGEVTTVQQAVDRLNTLVPSQSHTMADVGDHWANLWFAAQAQNWPLAQFMFAEARQHIRWTVAIRPVRQLEGKPVDIKGIWDGLEPSTFAAVEIAISTEDKAEFEKEYRVALESCYACHKASGLPFLRPQIPTAPSSTMINFDPKAEWPQ